MVTEKSRESYLRCILLGLVWRHSLFLQFVLFLDAPKDLCVERCLVRGAVSGRPDDNVESLGKRFETYIKDTLPIIKYYDTKGLVRKVSTVPPPEEVHVEISSIFKAANTAIPPGGVRKGL